MKPTWDGDSEFSVCGPIKPSLLGGWGMADKENRINTNTTLIIASLGVVSLAIGTDFTGALMLVVPIEREYTVDITTTQWMLNIYALTFAMGLVAAGRLSDMIYHLDEPQADPAPINALLISELARENGIKVLLSGAGQ